ncbi:MAG: hypothetical protein OEV42_10175 [Deltaproteobacteria bacterium]|nr:hypothetical protein [Deltaproteobacteria bacterium]
MSMFLGPIHQWLYNKIQIGAGRATAIEEAFKTVFSAEAEQIIAEVDDKYPAFPIGIDLEDIIGDAPIHGFLSGLIRMVESREGALIGAFAGKFGEKAKATAIAASEDYGKRTGEGARDAIAAGNKESLFKALYDRQLDGMPCDQGASPTFQEGKITIRQSDCLHSVNWQEAGAPLDVMCQVTGAWIKGFLKGAAPSMNFNMEASIIAGAGECQYVINN